jgi:hypothetical protein
MRGAAHRDPSIPPGLDHPLNRAVLAHVAPLSAHSDLADVLQAAVKPLGDVQLFCPDWQSYRAVVVSTKGIVFGFATGMDTVAFRLDPRMRSRAVQTGGLAYPACGDDWVAVLHHRPDSDWPAVDVRFWALKAYGHVREL